ncbi:MAG: glycosyltransferase family 2 protein [Nitrososphaerales archaeon]
MRYSICITHYDDLATVRRSLESILSQVNEDYEVVVVDSESDDGSQEVLREYARRGTIKLIVRRCSRGRGRQIAFENSKGQYIVSNVDMDDVASPRLGELLQLYHAEAEGKYLRVTSDNVSGFWGPGSIGIVSRELALKLGGWKDLQIAEDYFLERAAAAVGRYAWTSFPILQSVGGHRDRRSGLGWIHFNFLKSSEFIRAGGSSRRMFPFVAYNVTRLVMRGRYRYPYPPGFRSTDRRYFVNIGGLQGARELTTPRWAIDCYA